MKNLILTSALALALSAHVASAATIGPSDANPGLTLIKTDICSGGECEVVEVTTLAVVAGMIPAGTQIVGKITYQLYALTDTSGPIAAVAIVAVPIS